MEDTFFSSMTNETCKRFASSCKSEPISLLPLDNLVLSPCEMDESAKSMSLNLTVEDRDKSAKPDMVWKNKDSACKTHVLVGSGVSKRTVCVGLNVHEPLRSRSRQDNFALGAMGRKLLAGVRFLEGGGEYCDKQFGLPWS